MILAIALILTLMLLAVVYFDATQFIIPNELNLAFILIYPAFLILTPTPIEWWWSLAVMGAFLGIGFLIFMTNIMGGGDIKLLIALSLWIGWEPEQLMAFGVWTALAGGVLAVFLIIIRLAMKFLKVQNPPKVFRMREPLPYGLAISYAFGFLLWTGQIKGLAVQL